jgi:hypothetical protein
MDKYVIQEFRKDCSRIRARTIENRISPYRPGPLNENVSCVGKITPNNTVANEDITRRRMKKYVRRVRL